MEQQQWRDVLIGAVQKGDSEILEKLIKSTVTVDLNFFIDLENTPLILAIYRRKHEIVETLLKAGANVHFRNKFGNTPFNVAAMYGDVILFKMFLNYGGDITATDSRDRAPLNWAARYGHYEAVEFLLEHGAKLHDPAKGYIRSPFTVHPPHLPLPTPLPAFGPCQPLSILFPIAPPPTGS